MTKPNPLFTTKIRSVTLMLSGYRVAVEHESGRAESERFNSIDEARTELALWGSGAWIERVELTERYWRVDDEVA